MNSSSKLGGRPTRFVVVAGNIGVGKSSLVDLCAAARPGVRAVPEPADASPYLADFYADMARWAFPSQVFFLARRAQQHQTVMSSGLVSIQDRSIYEDAQIFARNLFEQGTLPAREWRTYLDVYEAFSAALVAPDAVVYLRARVETLEARIARRGRAYEQSIPRSYLERLNVLYDEWARTFKAAVTKA